MERILTALEMKKADKYTIEKLCVPESTLIERAGLAVATEITKTFKGGRVLVVCGKGNNGKDGKVVANILRKHHGYTVVTINICNGIFRLFSKDYDIIVDCIFGTGLNREVSGKYKEAIEKINSKGAYVISVDIPSGLSADTGKPLGVAVKANMTIAIGEYKLGHFINDGVDYCGKTILKDIGISVWGEDYFFRIDKDFFNNIFTKRNRNVNKGNFGKVAIVGGSKNFSGSILLSYLGLSALKMGIGYSCIAFPKSLYSAYVNHVPECTNLPLLDNDGYLIFDKENLDKLFTNDVIIFGMGVGVSEEIYKILSYILKNYKGKLLIDADGLNTLSKYGVDILLDKKCQVVMTPHVGEFVRLTKTNKQDTIENITNLAIDFAKKYDVIINVKSAVSVITNGVEKYLNTVGSSCMAKGGSGDVLSGIIGGLLVNNEPIVATLAGAYIFGKAGEYCEKEMGIYTPTAIDLVKKIDNVVRDLL